MPTHVRSKNITIEPFHGHISTPESRAHFAWVAGEMDDGQLNQREAGKGFPGTASGAPDPLAPADVPSAMPPPDGKIASANQGDCDFLDEVRDSWKKHDVHSGQNVDFIWNYTAPHSTRRWNYFITNKDWDSSQPLSRAQFGATPFHSVQNTQQPYWEHREEMLPPTPTVHEVPLPERAGYHVVLAVWEIAETGNAFYQVVDLNFSNEGGGNLPGKPTGLKASAVTDKRVVLTWDAATGSLPVASYSVLRDGNPIATVHAPLLIWKDETVAPDTAYTYSIKAFDHRDNASAPSVPVAVLTLLESGKGPHAPTGLHSMERTAHSIQLMWNPSPGPGRIKNYAIYRGATPVRSVTGDQNSLVDSGLAPDTSYGYYVIAIDEDDNLSKPSNRVIVQTLGQGGEYPEWKLGATYEIGDRVSYAKVGWECIQKHTAHTDTWAPGMGDNVLWKRQ